MIARKAKQFLVGGFKCFLEPSTVSLCGVSLYVDPSEPLLRRMKTHNSCINFIFKV